MKITTKAFMLDGKQTVLTWDRCGVFADDGKPIQGVKGVYLDVTAGNAAHLYVTILKQFTINEDGKERFSKLGSVDENDSDVTYHFSVNDFEINTKESNLLQQKETSDFKEVEKEEKLVENKDYNPILDLEL